MQYKIGDASIAEPGTVIVHITNNCGLFGGGFSGVILRRYPEAAKAFYIANNQLGQIQMLRMSDGVYICHMTAQNGVIGRNNPTPIRYDALEQCLSRLALEAAALQLQIQCPKIGSGLASGNWTIIEALLQKYIPNATIFTLE